MNIAVLHRYPISLVVGTNASFVEFLKTLSDRGCNVTYITYKEVKPQPKYDYIKYLELPFTFDRSNNKDKVVKTFFWIFSIPFFIFFWKLKYKFDLIYCDDSVPYYGFLIKLLNLEKKVFIRMGDLQSGYIFAETKPTLFKIVLKIETFMWGLMDGIIAISQPFKDFIISKTSNMSNKVFVVEESVNLDEAKLLDSSNNTDEFVFLFHGSLVPCKGTSLLIEAFAEFNKEFPNTKLIIAGGGSEEKTLKKLAASLSPDKVEFTGWYDHSKLAQILNKTKVSIVMRNNNIANNFVVTTCLLENWSFKKPVIVPNLAAFKNIIRDGENGILFSVDNKEDLINKMKYLYLNQNILNNLGVEGFNTAKKYFSHKDIANKMADILISNMKNDK